MGNCVFLQALGAWARLHLPGAPERAVLRTTVRRKDFPTAYEERYQVPNWRNRFPATSLLVTWISSSCLIAARQQPDPLEHDYQDIIDMDTMDIDHSESPESILPHIRAMNYINAHLRSFMRTNLIPEQDHRSSPVVRSYWYPYRLLHVCSVQCTTTRRIKVSV
jgi:hypothetical protein